MSEKAGDERTLWICRAFIASEKETTTRALASQLGISKTNVHLHLTERAQEVCPHFVDEIEKRLKDNRERAAAGMAERGREYRRSLYEQGKVRKTKRR